MGVLPVRVLTMEPYVDMPVSHPEIYFDPLHLRKVDQAELTTVLEKHQKGREILSSVIPWLADKFAREIEAVQAELERRRRWPRLVLVPDPDRCDGPV
ncbi:MAG TPA: hypothetical protein VGU69_10650 [Rhizomicrobium sp.]|nr:hypothetical protein [Rhizomicrobium sp.]